MKVFVDEDGEWNVSGAEALRDLLWELRAGSAPVMVFLERDDGRMMVLGVGRDESILTYVDEGGRTYHSVGDLQRGGTMVFMCRNQPDEFMSEMAVSESSAMAAAELFFLSGERPENITWEPDWG